MLLKLSEMTGLLGDEEFHLGDVVVDDRLIDCIEIERGFGGEPTRASIEFVTSFRVGPKDAARLDGLLNHLEEFGDEPERPRSCVGRDAKTLRKLMRRLLRELRASESNGEVMAAGGYE
jgi:hypothetical protein